MAATPERIIELFGLAPQCGTVKVPRLALAFCGAHPRDRRLFQASYLPMVMSGAIPAEGQHPGSVRGWRQGVTQAEMAAQAGIHRTTFTRRLSQLADPAARYADARQRRQAELDKRRHAMSLLLLHQAGRHAAFTGHTSDAPCAACAAGEPCSTAAKLEKRIARPIGDIEHYLRPEPTPIFYRRRRFGMAARYAVRLGQRRSEYAIVESGSGAEIKRFLKQELAAKAAERLNREAEYHGRTIRFELQSSRLETMHTRAPSLDELRRDPESAAWWQPEVDVDGNPRPDQEGYKARSRWVWDPRILDPDTMNSAKPKPLSSFCRELMAYYEGKGLLEEWRGAPEPGGDPRGPVVKHRGLLQIHQKKVARELGCDEKTVYRANCKWERLGVLRIAAGNPHKTERGWRRGAQIVLYLPFRTLTDGEAEAEAERINQRLRQLAASKYAANCFGVRGTQLQTIETLRITRELLEAWRGREHALVAFWREASRRLTAAGVSPEFYRYVIPPTRAERPPGAAPPGSPADLLTQ